MGLTTVNIASSENTEEARICGNLNCKVLEERLMVVFNLWEGLSTPTLSRPHCSGVVPFITPAPSHTVSRLKGTGSEESKESNAVNVRPYVQGWRPTALHVSITVETWDSPWPSFTFLNHGQGCSNTCFSNMTGLKLTQTHKPEICGRKDLVFVNLPIAEYQFIFSVLFTSLRLH